MQTLTPSQLPALIAEHAKRGARPIVIALRTVPRLRKTCPFVGVFKLAVLNCFLNFSYERSVNRQRTREDSTPNFRTEANWFTHTATPAVVALRSNPAKLYLQLKVQRRLSCSYVDANGKTLTESDLATYLPKRSAPEKQRLERPVLTIAPALESVASLTIDGNTYAIDNACA